MRNNKHWTEKEKEYIKKNYGSKTAKEISIELDRTLYSVRSFITLNNIKKPKNRITRLNKNDTLCWCCKWATNPEGNPCTWSKKLIPLKDWEAEKKRLVVGIGEITISYIVKECKLFERDRNKNDE